MRAAIQRRRSKGLNFSWVNRAKLAELRYSNSIGERIMRARLAGGLSQVSLEKTSGCDQRKISLYERGLEFPTRKNWARLVKVLGEIDPGLDEEYWLANKLHEYAFCIDGFDPAHFMAQMATLFGDFPSPLHRKRRRAA